MFLAQNRSVTHHDSDIVSIEHQRCPSFIVGESVAAVAEGFGAGDSEG